MKKIPRPEELPGQTKSEHTGCGKMYVTINWYWNIKLKQWKIFEIFFKAGKAGGCANSNMEALGRSVTYTARTGADLTNLPIQLGGIPCSQGLPENPEKIGSCADAASRALKKALELTQEELEKLYGGWKEVCSYDPDDA